MQGVNRTYTLALIGEPESSELGAVTSALAEQVASIGEVESGDYLEKKNLADKSKLFHVGCYAGDLLVDVIHCPMTFQNLSTAIAQADRIVWVLQPEQLTRNLRCAIQIARAANVESHLLITNLSGLDDESLADEEMLDLLKSEAHQLLDSACVTREMSFTASISSGGDASEPAAKQGFAELSRFIVEQPIAPRMTSADQTTMLVEQCYGVKGPAGKPSRVAYGAVRGAPLAVGDVLTSRGLGEGMSDLRVSGIQQFGRQIKEVCSGSSASLMFHGAPKDQPRAGQVLTNNPDEFNATDELQFKVSVLAGETVGQIVGAAASLELATGPAHVSGQVMSLSESPDDPSQGTLQLKTSQVIAVRQNQLVLLGQQSEILAWGEFDGNVSTD